MLCSFSNAPSFSCFSEPLHVQVLLAPSEIVVEQIGKRRLALRLTGPPRRRHLVLCRDIPAQAFYCIVAANFEVVVSGKIHVVQLIAGGISSCS